MTKFIIQFGHYVTSLMCMVSTVAFGLVMCGFFSHTPNGSENITIGLIFVTIGVVAMIFSVVANAEERVDQAAKDVWGGK